MAVTRLKPGGSARCPVGVLVLSWSVKGADRSAVAMRVQRDDGSDAAGVSRTADGVLVPALPGPVTVTVGPPAGGTFANGLSVSPRLVVRLDGTDVSEYVLPSSDVSGLGHVPVLHVVPAAGHLQLRVADLPVPPAVGGGTGGQVGTGRPSGDVGGPPAPVEGLARLVAWDARRRLGAGRETAARRTELHVAVDRSASFLPHVRSGAAEALLEALLGVNTTVGARDALPVWSLSSLPEQLLPDLHADALEGYWARSVGDLARTGGCPAAPLVAATASAAPRTVVLLTDGPPPDLDDVADAVRTARAAGSQTSWHVLALCSGPGDPRVRAEAWRDELHALRPLLDEGLLTASSLSPREGQDWARRLLVEDEDARRELVDGLPFWSERP